MNHSDFIKQTLLKKSVRQHIGKMKKLSDRVPARFDVDDIHDLRVEYKKLRAFLRMLQLEEGATQKLKIPDGLKDTYRAAGSVRDLQLFLGLLLPQFAPLRTQQYVQQLEQKLMPAKKKLTEAIQKLSFSKTEKELLKHLPNKLHLSTVRKFVQEKMVLMQAHLLAIKGDDDIHSMRKHLKDLIYNMRIFQSDWNLPFPVVAWPGDDTLNEIATLLGDYNDLCFALSFIQTHPGDSLPPEENQLLENLQQKWKAEKETRQEGVVQKLEQLMHIDALQTTGLQRPKII